MNSAHVWQVIGPVVTTVVGPLVTVVVGPLVTVVVGPGPSGGVVLVLWLPVPPWLDPVAPVAPEPPSSTTTLPPQVITANAPTAPETRINAFVRSVRTIGRSY